MVRRILNSVVKGEAEYVSNVNEEPIASNQLQLTNTAAPTQNNAVVPQLQLQNTAPVEVQAQSNIDPAELNFNDDAVVNDDNVINDDFNIDSDFGGGFGGGGFGGGGFGGGGFGGSSQMVDNEVKDYRWVAYLTIIIVLMGIGVGGYFIWKKWFKK